MLKILSLWFKKKKKDRRKYLRQIVQDNSSKMKEMNRIYESESKAARYFKNQDISELFVLLYKNKL